VRREGWLHAGTPISCVEFSEDGAWLAVTSYDQNLAIWRTSDLIQNDETASESGEEETIIDQWFTKLPPGSERVGSLAFASPGSSVAGSLAVGCWNGDIFVYMPKVDSECPLGVYWELVQTPPLFKPSGPFDHATRGALVSWAPRRPLLAVTCDQGRSIAIMDLARMSMILPEDGMAPDGSTYHGLVSVPRLDAIVGYTESGVVQTWPWQQGLSEGETVMGTAVIETLDPSQGIPLETISDGKLTPQDGAVVDTTLSVVARWHGSGVCERLPMPFVGEALSFSATPLFTEKGLALVTEGVLYLWSPGLSWGAVVHPVGIAHGAVCGNECVALVTPQGDLSVYKWGGEPEEEGGEAQNVRCIGQGARVPRFEEALDDHGDVVGDVSDVEANRGLRLCGSLDCEGSFVVIEPLSAHAEPNAVRLTSWACTGGGDIVSEGEVEAILPVSASVVEPVCMRGDVVILRHRSDGICVICGGEGVKWWAVGLKDGSCVEHEHTDKSKPGSISQCIVAGL